MDKETVEVPMKRFLPLLAAGILGALFAGSAIYQALRHEARGQGGTAQAAAQTAGCAGNCCGAK